MKWIDEKIKRLFIKDVQVLQDTDDIISSALFKFKEETNQQLAQLRDSHSRCEGNGLRNLEDIHILQTELLNLKGQFSLKVKESEHSLREEFETSIRILNNNIDRKMEMLGNKKGLVTDLLKRIAYLEGQVEDKNVIS